MAAHRVTPEHFIRSGPKKRIRVFYEIEESETDPDLVPWLRMAGATNTAQASALACGLSPTPLSDFNFDRTVRHS